MVQIREHKHKRLTGPTGATVPVRANLPAWMIVTNVMVMLVAQKKEAAP